MKVLFTVKLFDALIQNLTVYVYVFNAHMCACININHTVSSLTIRYSMLFFQVWSVYIRYPYINGIGEVKVIVPKEKIVQKYIWNENIE